jgi:branched-chain amino acid aminotransferase
MIQSFEWRAGSLLPLGLSPDMATASAALPAGAYSTIRTYGGRGMVRLDEHVARLARSAGAPLDGSAVRAAIAAALDATSHPESRLRVTFAPPRLLVTIEPFTPPDPRLYDEGIRCATLPLRRERPQAKDTRFIAAAASAYRVLPPGIHEGLLVADDGAILEGLSSNFFALLEGALRTEDARALPGVTRSIVLDVAAGLLPVQLMAVTTAELPRLGECFITSASRGVLPVVAIDATAIGAGRPGPVTAGIGRRFEERIAAETERL